LKYRCGVEDARNGGGIEKTVCVLAIVETAGMVVNHSGQKRAIKKSVD
jgi:hypothetical protein